MSAEVLREAAVAIRADNQPWPDHDPCDDPTCDHIAFMCAVADWLEFSAFTFESRRKAIEQGHGGLISGVNPYALAVARLYLNTP